MKTITKLWILVALLAIVSPLGIILPGYFKAGAAWGEWSTQEIHKLVGYVPEGLRRLSSLWNAPIPDYTFKGSEGGALHALSKAYIISAVVGIAAVIIVMFIIGKYLTRKS